MHDGDVHPFASSSLCSPHDPCDEGLIMQQKSPGNGWRLEQDSYPQRTEVSRRFPRTHKLTV